MNKNSVSINNNIKVNDYDIVDDLELIDETITVQIVDAMFTSTVPDWNVTDPNSPYYIKNKPTKTSQFINDGEDGTSKYVTYANLGDQVKVADVQVNTTGTYNSVVKDKIAKIDLTRYVNKELRTGSTTQYKVLSDNNLTDKDKEKLNYITVDGDGTFAFTNSGNYKPLYNILTVNGVSPDVNKNIQLTAGELSYGAETVKAALDKTVFYKSATDKQIVLENGRSLLGKTGSGVENNLISITASDVVNIGATTLPLSISALSRPTVNISGGTEGVAFLSDIAAHNKSLDAHSDIRNSINTVNTNAVSKLTNAEMESFIVSGDYTNGKLVIPVDTANYTAGRIYQFIKGSPNSWKLLSNYQIENIYRTSDPTSTTVGLVGQLYVNINNRKTFYCASAQSSNYSWVDITPELPDIADKVTSIINNTTLIADGNGGFTAGNNYRLLDASGKIPVERLPSAVIGGITYGGSFDSNGVIKASSYTPEIEGQNISTIDKKFYKNYYFYSSGSYVLDGEQYLTGDFALSTGEEWAKLDNQGGVVSVNGQTGDVVLTYKDVQALPDTIKYGAELSVNGTTVSLLDQDGAVINSITTQDTTYELASTISNGLLSAKDYVKMQEVNNNIPRVIEL